MAPRFACGHLRHRLNTGYRDNGKAFCRACRSVIDARYHARQRVTLADIKSGPRIERLIRDYGSVLMESEPLRVVPVIAVTADGSPTRFKGVL